MTLGDLDSSAGDIVGVSLATSAQVTNLTSSDISFTAHFVVVDLSGTVWIDDPTPGTAVITLSFADTAAVPGPPTLFVLGATLLGVGAARARRRRLVQ